MFESKRKQVVVEPEPVGPTVPPHVSLELRDEVDPDPFIEEMVARLRDGLGSLTAFDEWGRPMSWRNVVRLAVGPMVSALRDAQTASEIAVTLMPDASEPVAPVPAVAPSVEVAAAVADVPDVQGHLVGWPAKAHESWEALPEQDPVSEAASAESPAEPVAAESPAEPVAAESPAEPVGEPEAVAAVAEVDEPVTVAAEVSDLVEVDEVEEAQAEAVETPPEFSEEASAAPAPAPTASPAPVVGRRTFGAPHPPAIFTPHSADKGAVSLSPFGTGQALRQGGGPDATSAQYDRFLSGLYGQKQQDRRDG